MAAPCDGNVLWDSHKEKLIQKVKATVNLGFRRFVINYVIDELSGKKGRARKGLPPVTFKSPDEVKVDETCLSSLQGQGRKIEQFTRYTAVVEEASQTHKMQTSPELSSYDFRAVTPTSENTFKQACANLDVDIISLDMTQKLPFMLKRTSIGTAIQRGIYFEVKYSPAIRDSTVRQIVIGNARMLVDSCKGKNIIISSECESPFEVRSPQDVANLALLFGLTPNQAKDAVSTNYQKLIAKSRSRKTAHCVLSLTTVDKLPPEDLWKIPAVQDEEENEAVENGTENDTSNGRISDSEMNPEKDESSSTCDVNDNCGDKTNETGLSEHSDEAAKISPRKEKRKRKISNCSDESQSSLSKSSPRSRTKKS